MGKGAKYGAIGGAAQAGLNILTMGTAYVPEQEYGDFGKYKPVYRRGTFITRTLAYGGGMAVGRNLVTNLTANEDYNNYLRAHETGHFNQQRSMGLGQFYGQTAKEYSQAIMGRYDVYGRWGTLEYMANRYSLNTIGYYYYKGKRYTQ